MASGDGGGVEALQGFAGAGEEERQRAHDLVGVRLVVADVVVNAAFDGGAVKHRDGEGQRCADGAADGVERGGREAEALGGVTVAGLEAGG